MKTINFLLVPLLLSIVPLDAMKRRRDESSAASNKENPRPQKKQKTDPELVSMRPLYIAGLPYPEGKTSSLKNGLCYDLAKKMKHENDITHLEGLNDDLIAQIKKTYALISGKLSLNSDDIVLQDVITWGIFFEDFFDSEEKLRNLMIQLVVQQEHLFLEIFLKGLRNSSDNLGNAVVAHDVLIAIVSKFIEIKPQEFVTGYFQDLPEGTLKMAIRFVYAIKYYKNLDEYDCAGLLCPNMVRTCIFMNAELSEQDPSLCYMSWHFDFSDKPSGDEKKPSVVSLFCDLDKIPIVFSLLKPILKRIYPGNAQEMFKDMLFKSIDLSGNEQAALPWLYLLGKDIVLKTLGKGYNMSWGLGPVKMVQEPDIDPEIFHGLA